MMKKIIVAAAAALAASSCTKLVNFDLAIVEPCLQDDQALNGIASFRMLSTGAEPDGVVAFTPLNPVGMELGLGDKVIVTVEAFTDDITLTDDPTAPTVAPKSVGRTMPFTIDETTANVKGTVLVGKVDSFGQPRDVDGACSAMGDNGTSIAGRHGHTATFIPLVNKVLLFGGAVWTTEDGAPVETFLKSAELYDPTTGRFETLPEPQNARAYHTATALPDGRVVIFGGFSKINGETAPLINGELIDVRQDQPYVTLISKVQRAHHTATLLPDVGLLVIAGGCTGGIADGCGPTSAAGGSTAVVPSIELINLEDPTKTIAAEGTLSQPRALHQAVGFPNGNSGVVAIIGGLNASGALRGVEILQVDGGTVQNAASVADALPEALVRHQATLFNAQQLQFMTTGGVTSAPNGALNAAAPGTVQTQICSLVDANVACTRGADLAAPRFGHATARMRDGTFVAIGGVLPAGAATAEVLRNEVGTNTPVWVPTAGALSKARDRAAFALMGGDDALNGFVNQVFYSGGHTLDPLETSNETDIYFGN